MTEFIPVMPLKLMPYLSKGQHHFCQAHLFGKALEEGLEVATKVERWLRTNANTLILDNGSFELEGKPDVKATIRMAKMLKPFEVVCPDAFKDKDKTLKLFHAHAENLSSLATRVMIVPHGDSVVDWIDCLEEMLGTTTGRALPEITIGVPKVLDSYPGGRSAALAWIEKHLDVPRHYYLGQPVGYDVHLLGMWQWLATPIQLIASFPWIRSWDSTWPYACATEGEYATGATPKKTIKEWYPAYVSRTTMRLTEINIAIVQKATAMACKEGKRMGHG